MVKNNLTSFIPGWFALQCSWIPRRSWGGAVSCWTTASYCASILWAFRVINTTVYNCVNLLSDGKNVLNMRVLFGWLKNRWANYKYRFTPWIALNLDREAVKLDFELSSPQVLLLQLHKLLEALEQYTALRDNLGLYDELHQRNQVGLVLNHLHWLWFQGAAAGLLWLLLVAVPKHFVRSRQWGEARERKNNQREVRSDFLDTSEFC